MDEATKRRLGEDLEPGRRAPAPGALRPVQAFLNTWNHEFPPGWDRLGTPERARDWLVAHDLIQPGSPVSQAGRDRLVALREALRDLVRAEPGSPPDPAAVATLNRAGESGLRVMIAPDGRPSLEPISWGVDGATARLLGLCHRAWLEGTWGRLKGCRRCGWAFYDRSKNRSGSWCSMSICGNRTKNRAYRRRSRSTR